MIDKIFGSSIKYYLILTWLLLVGTNVSAKDYKLQHSIGGNLLFTYKPTNKILVEISPNNKGLDYVYGKFRKYKYPGVFYYYTVQYKRKNNLKVGLLTGCNVRYLEEIGLQEYQTYYSFPLNAIVDYKLKEAKHRSYFLEALAGYNFKYPKHKYTDGLGGWQVGMYLIREHVDRKFYMKFGFDLMQERTLIKFNVEKLIPGGINEVIHVNQYLNQFIFGIGKRLN